MVKGCAKILLQSTPPDVDLDKLKSKLSDIKEVHAIHDLHVWQLIDGLSIGSVHVVIDHTIHFSQISDKIKKAFHKMGVHSTSIQPEYVDVQTHNVRCFIACFIAIVLLLTFVFRDAIFARQIVWKSAKKTGVVRRVPKRIRK
jgi:hypothetical protein